MTYTIQLQQEPGFLLVTATGSRTQEAVAAMAFEIAEASIQGDWSHLLVDVRELHGRLSVIENYQLVTTVFPQLSREGYSEGGYPR